MMDKGEGHGKGVLIAVLLGMQEGLIMFCCGHSRSSGCKAEDERVGLSCS